MTMAEPAKLEPQMCNRLTRYLHTGNEVPRYYPGCWTTHKYFEVDKLPVIAEIMELHAGNVEVIDIIVKVIIAYSFVIVFKVLCVVYISYLSDN